MYRYASVAQLLMCRTFLSSILPIILLEENISQNNWGSVINYCTQEHLSTVKTIIYAVERTRELAYIWFLHGM